MTAVEVLEGIKQALGASGLEARLHRVVEAAKKGRQIGQLLPPVANHTVIKDRFPVCQLAAPLLVSLRRQQIRALERKFAEDAWDQVDESPDQVQRRLRKRAERWSKSAAWWIGPLTRAQRQIIREITRMMPNTATDWAAYRGARQARLIQLLDRKAREHEIRRYLTGWLADHKDLPPLLRTAKQTIRNQIIHLFVHLDASASWTQRIHLKERLANLRDDFMGLQKDPRMAPLRLCRGVASKF